ncbi:hypothetical protein [Cellulosilyticum sp. I15G10I2]|uniref:hypothetical protein n=1 Tax=Cellulosilyticum sp. I15G10I2 TaxID=1892843 RepID=UPI00114CD134|nr:hypothetical protein [Cellulosilyticum sp. I15G10I2]
MAVSNDKYELPLVVTDTRKELSQITGIEGDYISKCIYRNLVTYKWEEVWGNKFVRIQIEEEEDE